MWNERGSSQAALRPAQADNAPRRAAQPDNALEAMGPVLESVLGSLTMEYERRLMQKDQEIKACADELNRCRSKIQQLEQRALDGPEHDPQSYQMVEDQTREIQRLKMLENDFMQQVRALAIKGTSAHVARIAARAQCSWMLRGARRRSTAHCSGVQHGCPIFALR